MTGCSNFSSTRIFPIDAVQRTDDAEIDGGLMIIEPGRVRLRRAR